jgi:hypothetical protein
MYTHTHTHTHTCTHTHRHRHTRTRTLTHAHTQTHTHIDFIHTFWMNFGTVAAFVHAFQKVVCRFLASAPGAYMY